MDLCAVAVVEKRLPLAGLIEVHFEGVLQLLLAPSLGTADGAPQNARQAQLPVVPAFSRPLSA